MLLDEPARSKNQIEFFECGDRGKGIAQERGQGVVLDDPV